MVKLAEPKKGLNPDNHIGKKVVVQIVAYPDSSDCLKVTEKTTSDGKRKYNSCNLAILYDQQNKELAFLMENQLDALKDQWGIESKDWVNLYIEIEGIKAGQYTNWVIKPTPMTTKQEEKFD